MRPRIPILLTLAAFVLFVGASCKSPPQLRLVGRVVPRTPVALPPEALLEVQVADVTRTDAAPLIVARCIIQPLGVPPWKFTLRADSLASLDPSHIYSLTARVLADGKLRLVSRRRTVVDPARLADTLEVVVEPAPRTVGALFRAAPEAPVSASASDGADLWNPPGRPVTLPAPKPALVSFAAGPVAGRARGPHSPTETTACPPSPAR